MCSVAINLAARYTGNERKESSQVDRPDKSHRAPDDACEQRSDWVPSGGKRPASQLRKSN